MKVNQAELTISAVSSAQYPDDALPEIALAGRSNVGKSSFINKMIYRKSLARTSSKPGKTQTLNFYKINEHFFFVDVPGYGYAKVSKAERNKWGRFIEEYLVTRQTLQAVCLLVDMRHPPSKDDRLMYNWLVYLDLPIIVIATKADKISKGKVHKHVQIISEALQVSQDIPVLPFSSETSQGRDEVWERLIPFIS